VVEAEAEEEAEEEESLFKADAVNEEEPRARPRYPGVEDEFRRATFLRETHAWRRRKERAAGGALLKFQCRFAGV